MSIARAQYKLPSNCRNIMDIGDFYYVGPYLAGRDMKPISFDRVTPSAVTSGMSPFVPFNLSGTGAQVSISGTTYNNSMTASQSLFSDSTIDTVFASKSGATAGRSFIISQGGVLSEIKSNAELEVRASLNLLDSNVLASVEYCTIIDENIDWFFVAGYSRFSNNSTAGSHRLFIIRVSKLDFTHVIMTSTSSPTSGAAGVSHINKALRYIGRMADGRHLFIVFRTTYNASYAINNMWYLVLDTNTVSGTITYSSSVNNDVNQAFYSYAVPTGILPSGEEGTLGHWYKARQSANDSVTIIRRRVPAVFSGTTIPQIPTTTSPDYTVCTITGLPQGVVLPTPGEDLANTGNTGQISSWIMRDGNKNYLMYFCHNGGTSQYETSSQTPISRHVLFVLEIDPTDSSKLIYRSHLTNAFGYSQQIMTFCASADRKTLVVGNTNGFGILSWSTDAQTFTVSPWRSVVGVSRISFDNNSQIWVENSYGEVYIFNPELSASVVVAFEDNTTSVLYSGTTLGINAIINVYNFVGTRIARTVRLQARGCTFVDGTTTKDITTLATDDTIERVFINGQGNVTVDAFLL